MDTIVENACRYYSLVSQIPAPAEVQPSKMWRRTLDNLILRSINEKHSSKHIIKSCTEGNWASFPLLKDDPMLPIAIKNYHKWTRYNDLNLSDTDYLLQESPYTSDKAIVYENGRRISAAFLWHFACCQRIHKLIPTPGSVLELGGGYGGLARIFKMVNPKAKYCILDIPEMLFVSYIFLAANFPNANILFVQSSDDLNLLNSDIDFALIPNTFVDSLAGLRFDLFINTQSLSEMTQSAYDRYMQLLQNELHVEYFYNVNRFGPHPDGVVLPNRADQKNHSSDICSCASALDSNWTLLFWSLYNENNVGKIYPNIEVVLEILMKRVPGSLQNPYFKTVTARGLFHEATAAMAIDDRWHRLMWESIRLDPQKEYLDAYIDILTKKDFWQANYYKKLRDTLYGAS